MRTPDTGKKKAQRMGRVSTLKGGGLRNQVPKQHETRSPKIMGLEKWETRQVFADWRADEG